MNIPLYVTAAVVAVGAIAAIALPIILARVSKRAAPPVNVATPVGLALGAWFVLITILAAVGAYRPALSLVLPPVGLALLIILVGTCLSLMLFPGLRSVLDHPAS